MKVWLDANLPPSAAQVLHRRHQIEVSHVWHLGFLEAADEIIFRECARAGSALLTKDRDFVNLLNRLGPPPPIIWLRCGNCSNRALYDLLAARLPQALDQIERGKALVEIE